MSVKVEVDSVVSKSLHVRPASGLFGTVGVWWSHIGWPHANDVVECHFILDHLGDTEVMGNVGERVVRPSVRSDLVTFGDHSLDQAWVW